MDKVSPRERGRFATRHPESGEEVSEIKVQLVVDPGLWRGFVIGALLALPMWGVIGLVIWLVVLWIRF